MEAENKTHRGEYTRGYLPTIDKPFLSQFVTFRLADSLPQSVLLEWKEELRLKASKEADKEIQSRSTKYLDAGYGSCLLQDSLAATEVIQVLHGRAGRDYELLSWVVMPNHVHVLVTQGENANLAQIVHAWKSVSAHRINKALNRSGKLWSREYFDRYVRDVNRIQDFIDYIEWNPVKAGLCTEPGEWEFSSACLG